MLFDSRKTADVLLPLALEGPYTYSLPQGLTVRPGDYVEVPLGPRSYLGCVWRLGEGDGGGKTLREIVQAFDLPAMSDTHRAFIDWVANYYIEPIGNVLRDPSAHPQVVTRVEAVPNPRAPRAIRSSRRRRSRVQCRQ